MCVGFGWFWFHTLHKEANKQPKVQNWKFQMSMKFKLLRRLFPELRWPAHSHHIILAILPLYGRKYAILILMAECFCLHFWLPQQLYTYILDSLSNDYQWSIQLWICNLIKKTQLFNWGWGQNCRTTFLLYNGKWEISIQIVTDNSDQIICQIELYRTLNRKYYVWTWT